MRACLFAVTVLIAACGPSTREGPSDPNAPCNPGAVEKFDGLNEEGRPEEGRPEEGRPEEGRLTP